MNAAAPAPARPAAREGHPPQWPGIAARVVAAILGVYAFAWSLAAAGIAALVALGVDYHDAEQAVLMLTLLVQLGLFLWCFAAARVARVWQVLVGGSVVLWACAWATQRALLS